MNDNYVCIGAIIGTHGVNGEVKVLPLTDFPERFKKLEQMKLETPTGILSLTVENVRLTAKSILVKFTEIASKEAAAQLKKCRILVDEQDVYPLPEGVYYHFQLKGLRVYDKEIGYIGVLNDIIETGANDVYVLDSPKWGEVLIPAIKQVIKTIDLDEGSILVELLPGLIDDNS